MGFKWKINGGALVDYIHDSGDDNFWVQTGLDPGTEYCAQALAYSGALDSGYTSPVCATTTGAPPAPPTPVNLALASLGTTVSVLSELDAVTNPKGAMIDGERLGGSGPSGGHVYSSVDDPRFTAQWAEFNFGSAKTFSEVDIIGSPNFWGGPEPVLQSGAGVYNFSDFKFQYWNGSAWVDIYSWASNSDWWRKQIFSPITAQLTRLYVTGCPDSAARMNCVEVEIYEAGKNPVNIIGFGNSRAQNTDYSWTRKLQWNLNHNYSVKTVAIGGLDIGQMIASSQIADATAAYNPNASDNVAVFIDGVNDFGHSRALADVKADTITFCNQIRALGYKLVYGNTAKATTGFIAGGNATNLDAYNVWSAANWTSFADAYIDIAGQPEFADPETSTGYYPDHTHFSDIGGTVIGGLIADAINPWYPF